MKVLIACEFSGAVRRAFRARGHDAWSCDLLPAEDGSPHHLMGDVKDWLPTPNAIPGTAPAWDLVIAHPPCTHLAASGARWWKSKPERLLREARNFFRLFTELRCRWAIENPIGSMSTHYRKPDQIIQPWQFGHGETKATCLWLNECPPLKPTNIVLGRAERIHRMPESTQRSKERSRTYAGIAEAMAAQWG